MSASVGAGASADPTVRRNDERSRYELVVDGRVVGVADFTARGEVLDMPHTEVDRTLRGQGLAAVMVRAALDDVRRRGERVIPNCWYVADFIRSNPAYTDLVAQR